MVLGIIGATVAISGQRVAGKPVGLAREAGKTAGQAKVQDGRDILLVYDFGGGTFDVTVLKQEGRECSVLASRGDGKLGGIDLDLELYSLAAKNFSTRFGLDIGSDRRLAQQLSEQAERAKIELSERRDSTIALPFG